MTATHIVLLATVAVWIIYDVFAAVRWGAMQTLSVVIYQLSQKFPIIPFGAGVLCGHLFAPMIGL